jgi:hypothetical protein
MVPQLASYTVSCPGGKVGATTVMVNFTEEINSITPLSNVTINDSIDRTNITIR